MGEVITIDRWRHDRECRCKAATLRAFDELRARQEPVKTALEAATLVFRFHHPEISIENTLFTVSAWLLGR